MNEIDNRLKNLVIVNARVKMNEGDIKDETNLINDLGYHSILTIKLIVEIEKEFDIEIDEEKLDNELFSKYENLRECILDACKSNSSNESQVI